MSLRERARDAVRSAAGALRADSPRLSVVVPVHNVEQYVAECLDSLLGQTFTDLEVVVVDDGSTDGSGAVVAQYAERFDNVRVVTTANHGLSAARNTGVEHARGELLAFADSDDLLPHRAYTAMVDALDQSGSDFVVGAAQRLREGRRLPLTQRQATLHRHRRLGVRLEEFPEMLADVFAWNKVFRRSFWDRAQIEFPEGLRYEDQPALTKAFLLARSFDVLRAPVYFWRVREDRSSITQRRHEIGDLRDRLATKRSSLDLVRELGSPGVQRTFYSDALPMDLAHYFRAIPDCDDDYWQVLTAGLRDLWADGPSFADTTLPVQHRVIAWLVTQGRRTEAAAVMEFAVQNRPLPVEDRDGRAVALLPYVDDPGAGVPAELYRLSAAECAARERRMRNASARAAEADEAADTDDDLGDDLDEASEGNEAVEPAGPDGAVEPDEPDDEELAAVAADDGVVETERRAAR